MDFTVGLLALAVGVFFDWQRLIPAIGDRIAAVCALTVGSAWLSGGQVGGWFGEAKRTTTSAVGHSGHELTSDIPASSGSQIVGVILAVMFGLWLLAMLPGLAIISKHVSPNVANKLTSGLIWMGMLFPPLVSLIPGWWGDVATHITFAGSDLGQWFSGRVLG